MPVRGPEPIQRRSLAILTSDTATVRSAPEVSTSESWAAWASKWLDASTSGMPVCSAISWITRAENPGGVLIPVPTAVPPSGSSLSRGRVALTRAIP